MENGGGVHQQIRAEDVISKLKDDGDFDRLRLKVIRKLKENEELRNSIISMVKQSSALNGPGVELMKPRQLSDAINQEVGDKVMNQISDSLWEVIRSRDGMRSEISETVQSVYNKLSNPRWNEDEGTSSLNCSVPGQEPADNNVSQPASPHETYDLSDNESKEPPGFSLSNHQDNRVQMPKENLQLPKEDLQLPVPPDRIPTEEQTKETHRSEDVMEPDNVDLSAPPGFPAAGDSKQPSDGSDDDLDVPPGFG